MADVNDMFNDLDKQKNESSFYVPGADDKKEVKGFFTPLVEGDYLGHIVKIDSKIMDIKKTGNFRARLYKYEVEVADENVSNTYTYSDINGKEQEVKGDEYKGRKFRGSLWRFLDPQKGDTFDSNPDGNKKYLYFCEAVGLKCPKEKRTINGEEVEVLSLPSINEAELIGKPVVAVVKKGRPFKNKEGKTRTFYDCKWIKQWKEGKVKKVEDEIPF